MCAHIVQSVTAQKLVALCTVARVRLFSSTEIRYHNPAITNWAFQFSVIFPFHPAHYF